MNIIEIKNLNAYFGDKQVLHNISLNIKQGRKTAIVGESGSGKTVLAQGLLQLNPAVCWQGEMRFHEQNILAASQRQLQQWRGKAIGMVFQEPMTALNPLMTVGKQIVEVLRLHLGLDNRQAWKQAIDLLKQTGINDAEQKVNAYPFQLSGGQRQRAMIAMAIAAEPELLIADEPTTALDVAVQAQILDLLQGVQSEKAMTLLYITHDLNLVRRFADDVIVMRRGEIVEQGSVAEIFGNPQHEYTQMLLNATPSRLVQAVPSATAEVLRTEDLSVSITQKQSWFRRTQKTLLQPVSFALKAGETLGVIGESGSGKTTLAKALLALMSADGSVQIAGESFQNKHRRDIQMVFQDPFSAFNPRLNVLQIVGEGLSVHEAHLSEQAKRERVQESLRTVGLSDDILMRYPHEFSGGQRQRLAIARAMIVRPKVLVLDEPTSALDVQWQGEILRLLADLQQQYGVALILVSHDLAVIRALSHRVLVLQNGQVVEEGECEKVFASPNHQYTRKLLLHFNS
ncbi:MAG: dipeptide ABC transporter ATP-binding protein [Neisseria sp.]|nr:dipeptide ABC transporter ATP-binding protein [Neisseria sp.]